MRNYDKEAELKCLVEKVKNDPKSFLNIVMFQQFMTRLEDGEISDEVVNEQVEILNPDASMMAGLLLRYQVRQIIAEEIKKRKKRDEDS